MVTRTTSDPQVSAEEQLRQQWQRERARHEMTIGSIRSHIEEQPSPHAARACARRWCSDITNLVDSVLAERQNQEQAE